MSFVIVEAPPESAVGYRGYGAALDFWLCKEPEILLEGAYETGKTLAALNKLHTLLAKYPNCRGLMVRRSYASLKGSALVTYEQKVLPYPPDHRKSGVVKMGGSQPSEYHYPNGSVLVLGGLDNPNKFLSAEYDYIYINQMEEIRLDDYEKLAGRATGRAGNAPYPQVMGDCNPDTPEHWILKRARLKRFKSRHEDNPTLFDQTTGEITERGRRTMGTLDALTGVRYQRGRLGLWAGAEGQVYEKWDNMIHVINRFAIPPSWRKIRVIDFGYKNPFVCQWWAIDHDGRMHRYRELYMSGRTVARHKVDICIHSLGETYEATIADHDAEDRASLAERTIVSDPALVERLTLAALGAWQKATQKTDSDAGAVTLALEWAGFGKDKAGNITLPGIATKAADKRVKVGIEKMQDRLAVTGDGKPRLFLMLDSLVEEDIALKEAYKPTCTEGEFPSYVWQQPGDGRPAKEEPVKENDHGMDCARYAVMYVDSGASTQGVTFGSITKQSRW